MNIYGYEYKNIRPLSASHMHDRDLSFDQHEVVTTEGLGSFYPHILSAIQDVSYNKFTPLFLTDKKDRTQFNTLQAAVNQYPQYRTTYMKVSGSNNYLSVNNGSGTALLSATNSNKGQNSYFEFEFVDQNHCYVRHTTPNRVLQYLTVSHTTTAGLTFTARNSGVNRKTDSQIFEYMFNEPSGTITLFANLSSSTDSSIPLEVLVINFILYQNLSKHHPNLILARLGQHMLQAWMLIVMSIVSVNLSQQLRIITWCIRA